MSAAAALSARDLVVRRGRGRDAFELRVHALELARRETLAVLGPNGAGKSTLLRALAGLERPQAGAIEASVPGPATMVFQRPIAFQGSVEHNLRVALLGLRLPRAEVASRTAAALARFGIEPLARRRAATLSGGELRRLALARAFARAPSVLLLDEPFDDLDTAAQEALSLDLRRAIEETDVGVAVVTHDLRRALLLSDRIAVLLDGELAQVGAREEVLAHPRSVRVAQLVGMSNLVEGRVSADGAWLEIDPQHRVPLPSPRAPHSPVCVGIRPEHLKVDVGRGEGIGIGKGTLRYAVSDGAVVALTVEWAGFALRANLLAGRGLARSVATGDRLLLSVRAEDVHPIPRDSA
jgi:ABC-type sulfate/molybdate transport systems ATPase subunit